MARRVKIFFIVFGVGVGICGLVCGRRGLGGVFHIASCCFKLAPGSAVVRVPEGQLRRFPVEVLMGSEAAKSWERIANGPTPAVMLMVVMVGVLVVTMRRTAVVAHSAPSGDWAAESIAAYNHPLAIDSRSTSAAGMRKAAAIGPVVTRLDVRGREHCEACDDG